MHKLTLFFLLFWILNCGQSFAAAISLHGIEGRVEVRKEGQAAWVGAQEGQELGGGDRVKVGKGSTVQLRMEKDTSVQLEEETELGIRQFDMEQDRMKARLDLALGNLKAKVGRLGKGSEFEVQTPTAVAAVRGTWFELWVYQVLGEWLSKLKVTEGKVLFCDVTGQDCEEVKAGEEKTQGHKNDAWPDEKTFEDREIEGFDADVEGSQDDFTEPVQEERHDDDFSNF